MRMYLLTEHVPLPFMTLFHLLTAGIPRSISKTLLMTYEEVFKHGTQRRNNMLMAFQWFTLVWHGQIIMIVLQEMHQERRA